MYIAQYKSLKFSAGNLESIRCLVGCRLERPPDENHEAVPIGARIALMLDPQFAAQQSFGVRRQNTSKPVSTWLHTQSALSAANQTKSRNDKVKKSGIEESDVPTTEVHKTKERI